MSYNLSLNLLRHQNESEIENLKNEIDSVKNSYNQINDQNIQNINDKLEKILSKIVNNCNKQEFKDEFLNINNDQGFGRTGNFFWFLIDLSIKKISELNLICTIDLLAILLRLADENKFKTELLDINNTFIDVMLKNLHDIDVNAEYRNSVEICIFNALTGLSKSYKIEDSLRFKLKSRLILKLLLLEYDEKYDFEETNYIIDSVMGTLSKMNDSNCCETIIIIDNISIRLSYVLNCLTKLAYDNNDVKLYLYKRDNFKQLMKKFSLRSDNDVKSALHRLIIEMNKNENIRNDHDVKELVTFLGSRFYFIDDVIESYEQITSETLTSKSIKTYQSFKCKNNFGRSIIQNLIILDKNNGIFNDDNQKEIAKNLIEYRSPIDATYLYLFFSYENQYTNLNRQRLNWATSLLTGVNINKMMSEKNFLVTFAANLSDKNVADFELEKEPENFFKKFVRLITNLFIKKDYNQKLIEKTEKYRFSEYQILVLRVRILLEIITKLKLENSNDQSTISKYDFMLSELLIALEQLDIIYYTLVIEKINDKDIKNQFVSLLAMNMKNACEEFLKQNREYSIPCGWETHLIVASVFKNNRQLYIRFDNAGAGCEKHHSQNKLVFPYVSKINEQDLFSIFEHLLNQFVDISESKSKAKQENQEGRFYSFRDINNKIHLPLLEIDEIEKLNFKPDEVQKSGTCVFYSLNIAFKNRVLNQGQSLDIYHDVISKEMYFIANTKLKKIDGLEWYFSEIHRQLTSEIDLSLSDQWINYKLKNHYKSNEYSKVNLSFGKDFPEKSLPFEKFKLKLTRLIGGKTTFTGSHEILNLFKKDNIGGRLKENQKILIRGEAGSGKTQLAKYIANQFGNDNNQQQKSIFYCVILIKLSSLTESFLQNCSQSDELLVEQLFSENLFELDEFERRSLESILKIRDNILWIFDGYNDISSDLITNPKYSTQIQALLDKKYLILTTRPCKQPSNIVGTFDDSLNLVGLPSNQIFEFYKFIFQELLYEWHQNTHVFDYFQNDSIFQKIKTFLDQKNLNNGGEILKLVEKKDLNQFQNYSDWKLVLFERIKNQFSYDNHILPIYLELVCILSKQSVPDMLLLNRAKLFCMMVTIKKKLWLNKEFKLPNLTFEWKSFDKDSCAIERKCKVQGDALENIAFFVVNNQRSSITVDHLKSIVDENVYLVDEIINLGFLQLFNETNHLTFIHKSFMHYFCALFLTNNQNKSELEKFINEKSYSEIETFRFIIGILNNKKDLTLIDQIVKQISTKIADESYLRLVVECLNEFVDIEILERVLDNL